MIPDTGTNAIKYLSPTLKLSDVEKFIPFLASLNVYLQIFRGILPSVVKLAKFFVDFMGNNEIGAKEQS